MATKKTYPHQSNDSPQSVSLSFKNHTECVLSWKVPKGATSAVYPFKWTYCGIATRRNGYGILYKNFQIEQASYKESLTRSRFYPRTSVKVDCLRGNVQFSTEHGEGGGVIKYRSATNHSLVEIKKPRKPTVSKSFNTSTGTLKFTIKTNAGTDNQERYDTVIKVYKQYKGGKETCILNTTTTDTEYSYSYDVTDHQTIAQNSWINFRCVAYARGLAGDSASVTKTHLIAWPKERLITSITADNATNGIVTINASTSTDSKRPVSKMELYRLENTTIGTVASAAAVELADWTKVAEDDGECKGFNDQKSAAMPDVQNHTWYRIVTTYGANQVEGTPYEAKCLYRAKDASSAQAIKFDGLQARADGTSVEMTLAWANDDYNVTQISWADEDDAWQSSEQPTMQAITWNDGSHKIGSTTYANSAKFVIKGLDEDTDVFVRARRLLMSNNEIVSTGEWCTPAKAVYPVRTGEEIPSVIFTAPSYIVRGQGIDVSWSFNGGTQKSWLVEKLIGSTWTKVAGNNGTAQRASIAASALTSYTSITMRVGITAGADTVYSDSATVYIYDMPEFGMTLASDTLTAGSPSVTVTTDQVTASVKLAVTAQATCDPGYADGSGQQVAGDVLFSYYDVPDWTDDGNDGYTATIDMDGAYMDGAAYTVTGSAVSAEGLQSDEIEASFDVDWAHQAEACEDAEITVDADEYSIAITPEAPEDADETDVFDLYRVSLGVAELIAEGVEFGTEVTDTYAPFTKDGASLEYRVQTRTEDGDVAWAAFEYELMSMQAIIDWNGNRLELPYDLIASHKREKPFEVMQRWDGSRPGVWDGGVTRTVSMTATIIELESHEQAALVEALGAYAGPCFVRIPDGTAMAANVAVDGFGERPGAPNAPIQLTITGVDNAGAYMAALPEEEEEG